MSDTSASGFRLGPIDLYLLGLPEDGLRPATLSALLDLASTGLVRLLDLTVVSRSQDGALTLVEAEDLQDDLDIASIGATGLIGHDDIAELGAAIPAGTSALLVAIELVYQRELAARVAETGAVLLGYERISAPIVNALIDTFVPGSEA